MRKIQAHVHQKKEVGRSENSIDSYVVDYWIDKFNICSRYSEIILWNFMDCFNNSTYQKFS